MTTINFFMPLPDLPRKNYSIENFGGTDSFTPKSFINKIYIQDEIEGTMRYKPIFSPEEKFEYKNRLYYTAK